MNASTSLHLLNFWLVSLYMQVNAWTSLHLLNFWSASLYMQVNASTSIHSDWQAYICNYFFLLLFFGIICNYFMSQVFSFFNNNKERVKEEKIYKTSKLSSKISSFYFLFPKKRGSYYKPKSKSGWDSNWSVN